MQGSFFGVNFHRTRSTYCLVRGVASSTYMWGETYGLSRKLEGDGAAVRGEREGPCLMGAEFLPEGWKVLEIIVVILQDWACI